MEARGTENVGMLGLDAPLVLSSFVHMAPQYPGVAFGLAQDRHHGTRASGGFVPGNCAQSTAISQAGDRLISGVSVPVAQVGGDCPGFP